MNDSVADGTGINQELMELIERRATIQRWLAGLEAQRGTASERVLERVRADYEGRLAETLAALSAHIGTLREELARAEQRASAAEQERIEVTDAIEEARLRFAIGEVPEEAWSEREARLLTEVERAHDAAVEASDEVGRLHELLARLDDEEAPVAGVEPETSDARDPLDFLDPDRTVESWEPSASEDGNGGSQEFLAEIDRALSGPGGPPDAPTAGSTTTRPASPDDEPEEDTAPKPGLKCGECGYTNDLSAWFCGVCGADVG